MMKAFDGKVHNMEALGDYHPTNPHDPSEYAPTAESLETTAIINEILYGVSIPTQRKMIDSQLNLLTSSVSQFTPKPSTTEMSPLTLAGFGSIQEVTNPLRVHWTHCPEYAGRLFILKANGTPANRSVGKNKNKAKKDCFVI